MAILLDLRVLRCACAAASLVALLPSLGGCVSAVDESAAFGFAPQNTATSSAADETELASASGVTGGVAQDQPQTESLKAVADTSVGQTIADKSPESSDDETDKLVIAAVDTTQKPATKSLLTPLSNPSVSAFAGTSGQKREANGSLYASLYTQSQAKVPLRNADAGKGRRVVLETHSSDQQRSDTNLPGVDPKSLFEIGQRASVDSELIDDLGDSYQLASLSGIARLAPSGLLIQRQDVVTNCFDTNLRQLISQIESRFKQKVVITSGFRSPSHNKRVNGAKASLHMACKAADLHVPGIAGQEVARFVRALPQRGGVGTYCHTAAIHVDVGARRDWNWPCRQRRNT